MHNQTSIMTRLLELRAHRSAAARSSLPNRDEKLVEQQTTTFKELWQDVIPYGIRPKEEQIESAQENITQKLKQLPREALLKHASAKYLLSSETRQNLLEEALSIHVTCGHPTSETSQKSFNLSIIVKLKNHEGLLLTLNVEGNPTEDSMKISDKIQANAYEKLMYRWVEATGEITLSLTQACFFSDKNSSIRLPVPLHDGIEKKNTAEHSIETIKDFLNFSIPEQQTDINDDDHFFERVFGF